MGENRLQLWLLQGIIFTGAKKQMSKQTQSLAAEPCSPGGLNPSLRREWTNLFHLFSENSNYLFILPSFQCQGKEIGTGLLGFLDLAIFITWSIIPNRNAQHRTFCAQMKPARETGTGTGTSIPHTALEGTRLFRADSFTKRQSWCCWGGFLSEDPEGWESSRRKMEEKKMKQKKTWRENNEGKIYRK